MVFCHREHQLNVDNEKCTRVVMVWLYKRHWRGSGVVPDAKLCVPPFRPWTSGIQTHWMGSMKWCMFRNCSCADEAESGDGGSAVGLAQERRDDGLHSNPCTWIYVNGVLTCWMESLEECTI